MKSANGAAMFGGFKMKIDRHIRHNSSLSVTSAGQFYRHNRHTPLKGVTSVTLVESNSALEVIDV